MSNKRRMSIKREGKRMFAPDCTPCYTYNSKMLTGDYDKKCFLEGWNEEMQEHESMLRREAEENELLK
jgi:hypothetical protein